MNLYICSTPYHILVSLHFIKCDDILILIKDHKFEANDIIVNLIKSTGFNISVFYISPYINFIRHPFKANNKFMIDVKKIKYRIEHVNEIVVFNDVSPVTQKLINTFSTFSTNVKVVEEGIGLYRDIHKRFNIFHLIFGKLFFGYKYSNIRRIGENSATKTIVAKYPSLLSTKQKEKKIVKFPHINFDRYKKIIAPYNNEFTIVLIGQPIVEDKIISLEKYNEILEQLFSLVTKSKHVLLIKPHYREDIRKYNKYKSENVILNNNKKIPIELLVNKKDTIVFTFYSSASINLSLLYGMKIYMLYDLLDVKLNLPFDIFEEAKVKSLENWNKVADILEIN